MLTMSAIKTKLTVLLVLTSVLLSIQYVSVSAFHQADFGNEYSSDYSHSGKVHQDVSERVGSEVSFEKMADTYSNDREYYDAASEMLRAMMLVKTKNEDLAFDGSTKDYSPLMVRAKTDQSNDYYS